MLKKLISFTATLALFACAPGNIGHPVKVDELSARPVLQPAREAAPLSETNDEKALRTALETYKAGNAGAVLSLSRQIAEQYPNTDSFKRSLFLVEQALILADRDAEADAAMLRARAEYPELADYAVFILAEYHFAKARYTRAEALYQQLTERYPKSILVPRSSFQQAQALLESYEYLRAAEAFDSFLQEHPRSELAPAAGMGLGRALTAEAALDRAVQAYRNVWVRYPGNPAGQDVEKALAELRASGVEIPDPGPTDLYERGRNLSRLNQHEKAVETFTLLLDKDPENPNRPEALFRIGYAAYFLGRRGEAAAVLEKMVRDYPSDPRTPEALNWLGKSYSKLGDWDKGVKVFQKILDRHPGSEWADDALFLTGNIYREMGDIKEALASYARLAKEYPNSKFADSGIWWRAWFYYTTGDFFKAEQALQELVNTYPGSFLVNQARYWQGRIAEQQGDRSRAAAYYQRVLKKGPYTYYGYRAAERRAALDTSPEDAVKPDEFADSMPPCETVLCPDELLHNADDGPPVWTDETRQILSAQPAYRKTLELMRLDMKKEAAAELANLQEQMPRKRGALIGLSKAFFELGDYYRSIMLVLRNYGRYLEGPMNNMPEDLWRLAYPQGYWENILSYARQYGQDPYFIAAIIREESQFQLEALSPAGARGLMQVMPATGNGVARTISLPGFNADKLYDADTGINIGTRYIGILMKRFKGDPLLTAAAYNAGPKAVAGWLGRNGYGKDRDAFVESIPYSETRGYVKKVLRNYAEYKRIYGRGAGLADSGMRIAE